MSRESRNALIDVLSARLCFGLGVERQASPLLDVASPAADLLASISVNLAHLAPICSIRLTCDVVDRKAFVRIARLAA